MWKLFKVRKNKLLTPFSKHKAFFHQTSNFSLIEKNFLQSTMKKLVSWGSMKEKVRSLVKTCFCVLEWCEKFNFSYFEKFSHFTNFDEMRILGNSGKILSTFENLKKTLTLSLLSFSKMIKCANEAYGVENEGLYRKGRQRVSQESSNNWFNILRKF